MKKYEVEFEYRRHIKYVVLADDEVNAKLRARALEEYGIQPDSKEEELLDEWITGVPDA